MPTVKGTNPNTGVTYVYDQHVVVDEETGKKKVKRKVIGKIDPVTGEIVPTSHERKKRKKKTVEEDGKYKSLYEETKEQLKQAEVDLALMKNRLDKAESTVEKYKEKLLQIKKMATM